MRRMLVTAGAAALIAVGCGGSSAPAGTQGLDAGASSPATAPAKTAAASPTEVKSAEPSAPASLPAGSIGYLVVNEGTAPVDVYVRSQGLVRAALGVAGLASGAVTAELFPPDPGSVVVLPAGSGDPTCISSCSFVASASTVSGEGDRRILVVRGNASVDLWANPKAASVGTMGNALRPADPSKALLIVDAGGVTDGNFGLNVAWAGGTGCAEAIGAPGLMLGGTSILSYELPSAGGSLNVHASSDRSCAASPVGGPVAVPKAASGSRTLLLLWGASGSMHGLAIPLS